MPVRDKANPWLRTLDTYVPGQIREGYIKLSSNENNYGPSPKVINKLRQKSPSVYRYPYKDSELRDKVASYAGVKPENILVGNGSDELIDFTVKTFKGDGCGLYPGFSWYRIACNANGRRYYPVQLEKDFTVDVRKFLKASKKAKILFIDNPNNPTGSVMGEADLKKILATGKITVIDEAYFEFYGKTAAKLIRKYDNLIVLRTFAKAFGLAGLRVGYAIAAEETIGLLRKVKPPFNVNLLAQEAALVALEDRTYMRSCVRKIVKDRKEAYTALSNRFKTYPSNTNFILVDTTPLKSKQFFNKLLKEKIIVRNFGRLKGFKGEYARITIGTTKENQKLLKTLR
ncbi:MAG: histidinol-phosphate transaminase [Candidatus Altiarchaeota archaeon]